MSSGGDSDTQSVINKTEIPPELRSAYNNILSRGGQLYDQGVGTAFYPGQTYVPMSPDRAAGLDAMEANARRGPQFAGQAGQALSGILGSATPTGASNPMLGALARGERSIAIPDIINQTADGGRIGANPMLDAAFGKVSEQISSAVGANAARRGLTGSSIEQDQLATNIGDAASSFYGNAYETDMNRALQAGGMQMSARQQDVGNALAGMGLQDSFANSAASRGLQGISIAPGMDAYANSGASDLYNIGGIREQEAEKALNDSMARWSFSQDAPWTSLGRYGSALGIASGGMPGTSSSTSSVNQSSNPLLGAAGGALMGSTLGPAIAGAASPFLGSGLGTAMTMMGPYGWLAGAGLGLLGAL